MADTDKKQVNVDFSNHPELYDGLETITHLAGSDRSKVIRKLVKIAMEMSEGGTVDPFLSMTRHNYLANVKRTRRSRPAVSS